MLPSASTRFGGRVLPAVVIIAAALLYLVGNGRVSLWDRDEPRYAQCSRQMLFGFAGPGAHAPGFIVPHFLDDLRTEKPPLIYWLQAGAMTIFGDNAFAARFPSAVAMIGVLILLTWVFRRAIGQQAAAWGVFVMASSGLTIMCAKMCLTDATLLLLTTTAQICTYAVYRGNRSWKVTLLLWGALGLGGLTKGPIVLTTIGSTMVSLAVFDTRRPTGRVLEILSIQPAAGKDVLDYETAEPVLTFGQTCRGYASSFLSAIQWWPRLRPLVGALILAVIVGPWLWLVHHQEPTFLPRLFGAAARHLTSAAEKHTAPPGFYFGTILGLFFPWCLLMPTTLTIAFRNRRDPVIRYCLAVIFGVWVFQEIMKTKLPFYILPIFPALALLTGDALVRCLRKEHDDLLRPIFMTAVTIFAGAVLILGLLPWLLFDGWPQKLFRCTLYLGNLAPRTATIALTAISVVYAASVFGLFKTRRIAAAAIAMGVGAMTVFALLFGIYLPNADFMRTSIRVADILRPQRIAPGDGVMIEYKEPSLAFYQGGTLIEKSDNRFLEKTPAQQWPAWIVMPKSLWDRTPAPVREKLEVIGDPVAGINYAGRIDNHQAIEVVVLRRKN